MQNTLEQRVEALEREIAELREQKWLSPPIKKDWRSTFGWAHDSKHFEGAVKSGEEMRKAQTYEKEIEARGGVGY